MKKLVKNITIVVIIIVGIFTGCEKEDMSDNSLNIKKSDTTHTSIYEVVDEEAGIYLNIEILRI